jgi:very-short-patch-repair endonuclease
MAQRGEVLVAIVNNQLDYNLAREKHWYRVPMSSQEKWLKDRWPPKWLGLYQTKAFGPDAYAVNYYAQVLDIGEAYRWELFPDQARDQEGMRRYYKFSLGPLHRLAMPIRSRRRRRIVFIPTTWEKFTNATEINDLYDGSSLENRLWAVLKQWRIQSERQQLVTIKDRNYFLDFAVYCASGKLDIETDGDEWHANPEKAVLDNLRDNDLESVGWRQLRFSTHQIEEEMAEYCLPKITKMINHLGGLDDGDQVAPRKIDLNSPGGAYQLGLFDSQT